MNRLAFAAFLAVLTIPCSRVGLVLSTTAAVTDEKNDFGLQVPKGFVVERVAAEPDVIYPMFAAFDERGRLFVAESSGLDLYAELKAQTRKCRIRVLEDPDERGRFRKSSIFSDNLVFPMGLVWRGGKLYVADPPDLITLEDTDGDGRADRRNVILTGFGHVDNGSLHGLTFGPDGMLYMTMGQPDGYSIKRRDGVVVHGKTGALLRSRPDGSDPEVLCRGFENLVEVVFTPRGDVVGTDNWFQRPSGGLRDALVHLVDGGLYPLQPDRGTPQPVTGEPLPPISLYPAVALSGLERYRGQAFDGMQGHLFSAQHNARKVGRHLFVREGATFRAQDFDFLTSVSPDFHPSDVLEDADGSLLVLDTGSWYTQHCPTGQIRKVKATGGIYRVRRAEAAPVADPRGHKLDWSGMSAPRLAALLSDARPAVRDRAQHTLSKRGAESIAPLTAVLLPSPPGGRGVGGDGAKLAARQLALWALAGIDDDAGLTPLRAALGDSSADIIVPAAKALGLRRDPKTARKLEDLLAHKELPVRLAAAEALARCSDDKSLPPLWKALEQPDVDRFLEHALIHALFHRADAAALEAALAQPHPRVQQAALILLDQPPRPKNQLRYEQVLARLRLSDGPLRQTAVGILRNHPEWAEQSLALLREWFEQPKLSAEQERGLRELTLAYQASGRVQELLAEILVDARSDAPRRILVLETMAASALAKTPATWVKALEHALGSDAPKEVRYHAVRTVAVVQLGQLDETLAKLAEKTDAAADLRLEALRAIILRRPKLTAKTGKLVLDALRDEEQPLARLAAAEILGRAQLTDEQLGHVLDALGADAVISPSVVLPALVRAATPKTGARVAAYLEDAVRKGWRPSEQELGQTVHRLKAFAGAKVFQLEQLRQEIAEKQKERLASFEPLLDAGDPARGRAVFFGKKVACAACHRIGAEGGTIGPDLTKIGVVRAGRDLLESILVPSSTIAQGYDPYVFVTDDGKVLNGLIARQTADLVVMRDAGGAELQLRKDRVQEIRRAVVSIMPEGLERALDREEFRDLLAYLQSLK
ncbi:MAG: HEAT repeat domain-containing protein [Gemmataceae bacterium]|nr:HEAT repeat domain-containing protein [Gemmataceae bacterium]